MNKLKIVIALLAFGVAAAIWIMTSRGDAEEANNPKYSTHWKCAECGHEFELTPVERREALKAAGGKPPIVCRGCQEKAAYQVAACPRCGTFYLGADVPGKSGLCPVCYPDAPPAVDEPYHPDLPPKERRVPRL